MNKINIKKIFLQHKKIFCYGIGEWGCLLTRYCRKNDLEIFSYIISESMDKQKEFYGKKVYSITEDFLSSGDGIILATTNKRYQDEITKNILRKNKCENIYFINDDAKLCKYFWGQYLKQVKRRSKQHIFSYLPLAQPIIPAPIGNWNLDNVCYGQTSCIKKYTKIPGYDIRNCTIDHAARFMKEYKLSEINPPDGHLYAMSDFIWKDFSPINVHAVGPFIRYVKSMISYSLLKKYRKKMGKTILVFPVHTGLTDNADYETNIFIEKIEQIKKQYNYDTVMVCCFCSEILKKDYLSLRKQGYRIVTAGYPTDLNFLRRLKTFILLATTMITNDVGTHLGYSISLNRPSYIVDMEIKRSNNIEGDIAAGYIADWEKEKRVYSERVKEIKDIFAQYTEQISNEQYDVIEKYWGHWKHHEQWR